MFNNCLFFTILFLIFIILSVQAIHIPYGDGNMYSALCSSSSSSDQEEKIEPNNIDYNNNNIVCKIKLGRDPSAVAVGYYTNAMNQTGWGTLTIRTQSSASDMEQAYAAGFLEGALTNEVIEIFWKDYQVYSINGSMTHDVKSFLQENIEFIENNIHSNQWKNNQKYWTNIALLWQQLSGLTDGVNYAAYDRQFSMSLFDMFVFNLDGDFGDIVSKFSANKWMPDPIRGEVMPEHEAQEYVLTHSHCSALIKLLNSKEVLLGHTTWDTFSSMNRIFKHYEFNFNTPAVNSKVISFSSSPGWISSVDDYYLMSSGLAVTETTNSILNPALYNQVKSHSVLSWMRVMAANRMASTPGEWIQVFSQYNSGTYNNQWMVFDMRRFNQEGISSSSHDLFWVAEQIPGYIESSDMTSPLYQQNYWPSYNIPYFPRIFNASGYPSYVRKYGNYWSHDHCPRANIFRRDHSAVTSLPDMMHIMRYNDWQNDPFSLNNACNAIAARCDLNPKHPPSPSSTGPKRQPFGGIDSKITSNSFTQNLQTLAICGPTHQKQPEFYWTPEFISYVNKTNYGQPKKFPFEWQMMEPHSS